MNSGDLSAKLSFIQLCALIPFLFIAMISLTVPHSSGIRFAMLLGSYENHIIPLRISVFIRNASPSSN